MHKTSRATPPAVLAARPSADPRWSGAIRLTVCAGYSGCRAAYLGDGAPTVDANKVHGPPMTLGNAAATKAHETQSMRGHLSWPAIVHCMSNDDEVARIIAFTEGCCPDPYMLSTEKVAS
jgi:hypothetical protein